MSNEGSSSPSPWEKIQGIEALLKRPSRAEDFEAENRALATLTEELANHPRNLFWKLTEIALELCRAESAVIGILEPNGKSFRWDACAGVLAKNSKGVPLCSCSPYEVAMERDSPILFEESSELSALLPHIKPPIAEALLLPFRGGQKPVGTVWLIAHSPALKFDREDLRLMTSLARFASAAYQFIRSMSRSKNVRDFLENRVDTRTKALALANRALRDQISERKRIEEAMREVQYRLEAELSSLNRLHELNSCLVNTPDLPSALTKILEAAVALLGANMGTIQLYDSVNKTMTIAAHHGFKQDFLDHFRTVDAEGDAACSRALASQQRLLVEDVLVDKRYAIHRAAADEAGYRSVQSTPLFSRDGKSLGMLSTHFRSPHVLADRELRMLDLYARQAADFIERRLITERLQDADRRKDEFIATLSHELRNPLAAIDSSARLMQSPGLAGGQYEFAAQVVQRQCAAMRILLDDLLDVSRLTLGRMTLHKQSVTLASTMDAALETAQPLIDAANHVVSVTKPPSSVMVFGDPIRLTQIFSNLLLNAVKYTAAGGRITVDVETASENVVVSITDNGIGIEPSCTEEIFGMFSQRETKSDRPIAGLGIGLALVRAIAELHGGWVRAESRGLGQGSTFHVGLPLVVEKIAARPHLSIVAPIPALRLHSDPEPHAVHASHAKSKYRILVADDNTAAATAISMLLQREGHETKAVYDGRAALEEAARFMPDIALLDIGMPHLNGYEVAREIRAASWGANMRLFAATGWGQEKDKILAKEAGFDVHMTKPIDFKQLLALIEEHGGKHL